MTIDQKVEQAERRITAAMDRIIVAMTTWRDGPSRIGREDAAALAAAAEAAIDAQGAFGELAEAFLALSKVALERG